MVKKNMNESNKQDKRLKPQEAAVFKNSKNSPKVSADLVIAQAVPETSNMDFVHVKCASKMKKSRPNGQSTIKSSKDCKMTASNSTLPGEATKPTGTETIASEERMFDYPISGEAQQLMGEGFSDEEFPVRGEEISEKENSDSEGLLPSKNGNISKIVESTDATILKRTSRANRSPNQRKISVKIKARSSSKLGAASLGSAAQDGNVNVTVREKVSKSNSSAMCHGPSALLKPPCGT